LHLRLRNISKITKFDFVISLAIASVLAVALLFRFFWLDSIPGINGDEAWMGWKVSRAWAGEGLNWYSNSGNLSNPFYLAPLFLVHGFMDPSGTALRIVAAISGVLMLVLNFAIAKRLVSSVFAWSSTLLLAVLPMNIAYSRFGWEPSQIPLFCLPFLACALLLADRNRNLWLWAGLAGVFSLFGFWVHPTMFFLLPMLGLGLLARWIVPEASLSRLSIWLLLGMFGTLLLGFLAWRMSPPWIQPEITQRVSEGLWLKDVGKFAVAWARLFSGVNTYAFLSGAWSEATQVLTPSPKFSVFWIDYATIALFIAGFGLLLIVWSLSRMHGSNLVRGDSPPVLRMGLVLGFGFLLPTLLFWIMNGSGKVAVWYDRYGLWALVPGSWFLCWTYSISKCWLKRRRWILLDRIADIVGILIVGALLLGFWHWYFQPFLRTGGEASLSCRTSVASDPKLAAAKFLKQNWSWVPETEKPLLISGDWFAFWPTLYGLQRKNERDFPSLRVLNDPQGHPLLPEDFYQKIAGRRILLVEFSGGVPWKTWDKIFENSELLNEWFFKDQSGREVLQIKEYNYK